MKYLWEDFDRIKHSFSSKKTKLVLLDFDGTLAPVGPTPDAVSLDEETRQALASLNKPPVLNLVMMSGRPLRELYSYLRLKRVIYAGNHGLEMKGLGIPLPPLAKKARKLKNLVRLLARKFEMAFGDFPGVLVEDKDFTLSLHYRRLSPEETFLFNRLVRFFKERYRKYPLVWVRGKKVWEIRPAAPWGKGDAVRLVFKKFPGAFALAVGDDVSDEEMFQAVKNRGVAIRVGHSKQSRADYYLKSPKEVKQFLGQLCY